MKPARRWHHTPIGRTVLFLGGIRFAVPVLLLVAAALAWGTWIESTRTAAEAGRLVYGSSWFIGLMLLVCTSLVLSVVTRFPWRCKHVGFITVHASLVLLIASAFLSFFTRVEGRIVLAEGEQAEAIQLDETQVEVSIHENGEFIPQFAAAVGRVDALAIAGASIRIEERWPNSTQEFRVTDDGANPLHAIELRPGNGDPVWIGQSEPDASPQDLDGVYVRVLPEGVPSVPAEHDLRLALCKSEGTEIDLPEPGAALPGSEWTVQQVGRFERAIVDSEGLSERDSGGPNPAVVVHLEHPDGSHERHIAFERFAGVHKTLIHGETSSPFVLRFIGAPGFTPLVEFEHLAGRSAVTIVGDDAAERFERAADGEWRIDSEIVGTFSVLREFLHARGASQLVAAPAGENNKPALVIAYEQDDHTHSAVLPWMQRVPLQFGQEVRVLQYGPVLRELPFALELADFRKVDYPGTDSAMAYESDVHFTLAGVAPSTRTISMNRPLEHAGWKVYQSGFLGETISVFQVTRDPGLIPTYIACIGLCVGIVITFYSRTLSRGHPGIPALFAAKTQNGGESHEAAASRAVPVPTVAPIDAGPAANGRDDPHPGAAADPASGPGHAVVHVRAAGSGATDRAHEMV